MFFNFILSQKLDGHYFNSSDWKSVSDISEEYWTVDKAKRFLDQLKSKGISIRKCFEFNSIL